MQKKYENLIQQGKLPLLRILKTDDIILHEKTEKKRIESIRDKIERSRTLQNPVICSRIEGSGKYILLDGAHRYAALCQSGCSFILAQIVEYNDPMIEINGWKHLFLIEDETYCLNFADSLKNGNVKIKKGKNKVDFVKKKAGFCLQILLKSGYDILVEGKIPLKEKVDIITRVIELYMPHGFVDRISYNDFDLLSRYYNDFTGLVIFPDFSRNDIIELGLNNIKLPAGITRHLIPKRALHLNFPLDVLTSGYDYEAVNQYLTSLIDNKIKEKAIRFYSESTFFFDD